MQTAKPTGVVYHAAGDKSFAEFESELRNTYVVRSRLTHGSLSPFDPEVADYSAIGLRLAEQVICAGLELFESQGFIDNPRTMPELGQAFDHLAVWAKAHSDARLSSGKATP